MSLMVFIGKKVPEVFVVRYFRGPEFPFSTIEHPSGSPATFNTLGEFRSGGFGWVKEQMKIYEGIRLSHDAIVPVFPPKQAKKLLKDRDVVLICLNDSRELTFEPMRFVKYDLGGLVGLGKDYRQTLPWPTTSTEFWPCFDAALRDAS